MSSSYLHGASVPALMQDVWRLPSSERRRVDAAIRGINQLACSRANSLGDHGRQSLPSSFRPTGLQAQIVASVSSRVLAYGDPPDDLSPAASLGELLGSMCLYSQEPKNLATFDPDRLKITKGEVIPQDLKGRLSPEVAAAVVHFDTVIERSAEEVKRIMAGDGWPKPYWDPVLRRSPSKRKGFLRDLVGKGIFGVRRRVKCFVGLFFVRKPGKDSIRMVIDDRGPNLCHHRPPKARLGNPAALSEIDFD